MRQHIRWVYILRSILVGGLFIYSAYAKTDPIQSFEYTFVEFAGFSWRFATLFARFFIGLELALGLLICSQMFGRKNEILKLSFIILFFFNIYLIYLWVQYGNRVNCGCFGDKIWTSPSISIIKNIILQIIIGILIKFHRSTNFKFVTLTLYLVLSIGIAVPFFSFPLPNTQPSWLRKDKYPIDLSPLYILENTIIPDYKLDTGKHIIAFFSPFCPHCKIAAYKMHLMKQNNPSLPFHMVLGGTTSDLTDFWDKSQAKNIPYSRLLKNYFLNYTGGVFPLIIWVNNGVVEAKSDYIVMDQKAIEQWLAAQVSK